MEKRKILILGLVFLLVFGSVVGASISFASISSLSNNVSVDKATYSSVISAGLTGYTRDIIYTNNNATSVCFKKVGVVNKCYKLSYDANATALDINKMIAYYEQDMIKKVAYRYDKDNNVSKQSKTLQSSNVSISSK